MYLSLTSKIKTAKWNVGAGDHGACTVFVSSLEITSFEGTDIMGSRGQYTLSCMNLHDIEFTIGLV